MNSNKKGNNVFIIVLLLIVVVAVFFFPTINKFVAKVTSPKVEQNDIEKPEKKEFDEKIIEDVHFPIMRNSVYSTNSNYLLDKFTISNLSNNDILLNAFLDMHEGNIKSLGTPARCGGESATFDKKYIELRIKNILGRNLNYKLETFEVPEGNDTKYPGTWTYDGTKFVYDGICNKNTNTTKYYDLKQLKEGKYEENDLILYYYLGFAKVEGNKYTIYSKADMKDEISSGEFVDLDSLQKIFESVDNKKKAIYKYVFKNDICTYSEYCLYEGSFN